MGGIVLLVGQIGVVVASFIGMSSVFTWYHGEGVKRDAKPKANAISNKSVR